MKQEDRTYVEKRMQSLRIQMRELGKFGRDEDFYIDGFLRLAKTAHNAADELERRKLQLTVV